jgi:hypothetical protein
MGVKKSQVQDFPNAPKEANKKNIGSVGKSGEEMRRNVEHLYKAKIKMKKQKQSITIKR